MADYYCIVDEPRVTTDQIWLAAMQAKDIMGGLDFIGIDYLQLVNLPQRIRTGNRAEEVGRVSLELRPLAATFNVPLVAVSQLRRLDKRGANQYPEPTLEDLRESGQIEQDAEAVIFTHLQAEGKHSLIIGKNKNGPIGAKDVVFDADTMLFRDEQGVLYE